MDKSQFKAESRQRRKRGIRKGIFGTTERPRLTIYRSNLHVYAQVVNDIDGKTLASASSRSLAKGSNVDAAKEVGKQLAKAAVEVGINKVAFDRNGYRFHGRVKALADAAREGGLQF